MRQVRQKVIEEVCSSKNIKRWDLTTGHCKIYCREQLETYHPAQWRSSANKTSNVFLRFIHYFTLLPRHYYYSLKRSLFSSFTNRKISVLSAYNLRRCLRGLINTELSSSEKFDSNVANLDKFGYTPEIAQLLAANGQIATVVSNLEKFGYTPEIARLLAANGLTQIIVDNLDKFKYTPEIAQLLAAHKQAQVVIDNLEKFDYTLEIARLLAANGQIATVVSNLEKFGYTPEIARLLAENKRTHVIILKLNKFGYTTEIAKLLAENKKMQTVVDNLDKFGYTPEMAKILIKNKSQQTLFDEIENFGYTLEIARLFIKIGRTIDLSKFGYTKEIAKALLEKEKIQYVINFFGKFPDETKSLVAEHLLKGSLKNFSDNLHIIRRITDRLDNAMRLKIRAREDFINSLSRQSIKDDSFKITADTIRLKSLKLPQLIDKRNNVFNPSEEEKTDIMSQFIKDLETATNENRGIVKSIKFRGKTYTIKNDDDVEPFNRSLKAFLPEVYPPVKNAQGKEIDLSVKSKRKELFNELLTMFDELQPKEKGNIYRYSVEGFLNNRMINHSRAGDSNASSSEWRIPEKMLGHIVMKLRSLKTKRDPNYVNQLQGVLARLSDQYYVCFAGFQNALKQEYSMVADVVLHEEIPDEDAFEFEVYELFNSFKSEVLLRFLGNDTHNIGLGQWVMREMGFKIGVETDPRVDPYAGSTFSYYFGTRREYNTWNSWKSESNLEALKKASQAYILQRLKINYTPASVASKLKALIDKNLKMAEKDLSTLSKEKKAKRAKAIKFRNSMRQWLGDDGKFIFDEDDYFYKTEIDYEDVYAIMKKLKLC